MEGEKIQNFIPLNVSSKFAICGLPLRVDTYKTCTFGCKYCFSNYRKIMEFSKDFKIANLVWLRKKLDDVYNKGIFDITSFLDMLLLEKITWHCGGMSDPFQPAEKEFKITKRLVDITEPYKVSILFSTKTDNRYSVCLNPKLHTFQLSITNLENNKDLEPNIPSIENRFKFFKRLKNEGFKVGIRIQPFIPSITTSEIVDKFREADYFSIEGLKLVPQNEEQKEYLYKLLGLSKNDFIQMGLLNLRPEIRLKLYKDTINKLEGYGLPYSIADNDLHYISKSKCCCGENLIKKSTNFNNTALFLKNNCYGLKDVEEVIGNYVLCKANHLFTSNRQEGCVTVLDFFKKRIDRESSPFSKKFMYGFKDDNQRTVSDFFPHSHSESLIRVKRENSAEFSPNLNPTDLNSRGKSSVDFQHEPLRVF